MAVVAYATAPETLAPATLFAVVANVTAPVTFAPVKLVKLAPLALILVTLKVFVDVSKVKFALPANAFALLNCTWVLVPAAFVLNTNGAALLYNKLSVFTLPADTLPVTDTLVSVPTLVIFGCAFVVTVPAVVAILAVPYKVPIK